jgi:hypothetical protein
MLVRLLSYSIRTKLQIAVSINTNIEKETSRQRLSTHFLCCATLISKKLLSLLRTLLRRALNK